MLLLALLTACSGDPKLPAGDPGQPDLILVSIDTLRADHLSSYGNARETSPFMDQLASQGVRFSHARSADPWTLPSHTTMLSGQLPRTHMVVEDDLSLDDATPVLPELMRADGYATGGFVSTMYVSRLFGFDRGFDRFEDFDIHNEKSNLRKQATAPDVVREALDWWEDQPAGTPVFLFMHLYDVHYEYDPPGDYATLFDRAPQRSDRKYRNYFYFKKNPLSADELAHQRAQYDEAIRYVDDQLRRVDVAAKAAGRAVRWVLTADHGEEFGERGAWGHAHTLYPEQLHVPLIMSGPGLARGVVVQDVVGTQDIAPTIAALSGEGRLQADGVDLAATIRGEGPKLRAFPAETSRFKTRRVGLYEGGLRLDWDLKANRLKLYDDGSDPAETHDLAKERPEDVLRMRARLEAELGHGWEARSAGTVETDGVILAGGRHKRLRVQPGDTFAVIPYYAQVRFRGGTQVQGPWKAVGGARPGPGDPLAWRGSGGAGEVSLTDEQRQALEALGYLQGGE